MGQMKCRISPTADAPNPREVAEEDLLGVNDGWTICMHDMPGCATTVAKTKERKEGEYEEEGGQQREEMSRMEATMMRGDDGTEKDDKGDRYKEGGGGGV